MYVRCSDMGGQITGMEGQSYFNHFLSFPVSFSPLFIPFFFLSLFHFSFVPFHTPGEGGREFYSFVLLFEIRFRI